MPVRNHALRCFSSALAQFQKAFAPPLPANCAGGVAKRFSGQSRKLITHRLGDWSGRLLRSSPLRYGMSTSALRRFWAISGSALAINSSIFPTPSILLNRPSLISPPAVIISSCKLWLSAPSTTMRPKATTIGDDESFSGISRAVTRLSFRASAPDQTSARSNR